MTAVINELPGARGDERLVPSGSGFPRHPAPFVGSVVLATPLSVRCLGLVLAAIVLAAVIFVSIASYARKATVTGWLVPDQGLIRATASSAGFIPSMEVKEGDRIERGAKLAEIQIAADTATGNVGEQAMTQLRAEAEAARAKAQSQIERLDAESVQARARLGKLRGELQQVQMQAELQEKRLALARQEAARSEELAARGLLRAARPRRAAGQCAVRRAGHGDPATPDFEHRARHLRRHRADVRDRCWRR